MFYCFLSPLVSVEKVRCLSSCCSFKGDVYFSFALKIFILSLIFYRFTVLSLGFFIFILFIDSGICDLLPFISLEK